MANKVFPTDLTLKATPVAGDQLLVADSADSFKIKKSNWSSLVGPTGATGATGATGPTGPQGPAGIDGISLNWKGPYNPLTPYVLQDGVSYNGASYICILASTGNVPTNGTYWNVLAEKGAAGSGSGDMLAATYDPTNIASDAFDITNHTGTLGIAHGGTNNIAFLAPSGNINPIIYYDGSKLSTNAVAADIGYDAVTNTIHTSHINVSTATSQKGMAITNTVTSGPSSGPGFALYSNDGSAMSSGDRLGYLLLGGQDGTSASVNATGHQAFATEAWSNTAHGSKLQFETTSNGTVSRNIVLTLDEDKSATFTGVVNTSLGVTALKSATTAVNVSSATAPTNGQVLTATSGTTATWQTPSSSSGTDAQVILPTQIFS